MSEIPDDLFLLTIDILKANASTQEAQIPSKFRKILTNPIDLSLIEIIDYYHALGRDNVYILDYMLALITLRVCKDAPMAENKGIEFFSTVKYFMDYRPEYKECIMNTYTAAIIQELSHAKPSMLPIWAEKISTITPESLIEPIKDWLDLRYISITYTLISKMQESQSILSMKEILYFIKEGQSFKLKIDSIANMSVAQILENIININDLRGFKKILGENINPNFEESREIIGLVKSIKNLGDEIKEKITFIEGKIGTAKMFLCPNYKKIPKEQTPNEDLKEHLIDWSQMIRDPGAIYAHSSDMINVTIWKSRSPDGQVVVTKTYTFLKDNYDTSPIDNEIRILTYLSNRATNDNCFLKYYGTNKEHKKVNLHMEAGEKNLMDFLTECKRKGERIEPQLIEKWIISLLNCFSELSIKSIYHCDIKPHNILVTLDKNVKVIDFSISKIQGESEATISPTMEYSIQGTRGYMAPELQDKLDSGDRIAQYKPGKADVFSLGMTFLQMINFEELSGLNKLDKNRELIDKVEAIKGYPEWIKVLLKAMLTPTRQQRPSFSKCLSFITIESGILVTTIT
ncbi:hypothetical protein SteCoe_27552 [Stentor coeruleus]|uniref:Protein kinase domain-containing protein n=1 Tax=Stentor coeruleus TaxID=5963 RepID=A0A1R2BAA3_9CILI|nr:hypothetical protein SteCoe_27552 [Stentor coeruleus]